MATVNDFNGKVIDFEAAMQLADQEICESMQAEYGETWSNDQQFIERYAELHAEKFNGEEFAPFYGGAW